MRKPVKQASFRIPAEIVARLDAASAVLHRTQAGIVGDVLAKFLDSLPPKDKRLIDEIVARNVKQKPGKDATT